MFEGYYDPPDPPDFCEVCFGNPGNESCICPECFVCFVVGDLRCYEEHCLTMSPLQIARRENYEPEPKYIYDDPNFEEVSLFDSRQELEAELGHSIIMGDQNV